MLPQSFWEQERLKKLNAIASLPKDMAGPVAQPSIEELMSSYGIQRAPVEYAPTAEAQTEQADPRIIQQRPLVDVVKDANSMADLQTKRDPKSGIQQNVAQGNDISNNVTENRATWADPALVKSFTESVSDLPSFQAQEEGQNRLEELLAMEASNPAQRSAYWTKPLAGLADYMNAKRGISTNNAGNVPVEETPEARNMKLMEYANKLQKDRSDYNARLLDSAKAFKSGSIQEQLMQKLSEKITAGTGQRLGGERNPQVNTPLEKVWSVFKDDKAAGKALEALSSAKSAKEELSSGTKIGSEMLKRAMLRVAGDTRFSDKDVSAFGGSSLWKDRLEQAYEWSLGKGSFTPKNEQEIREIILGLERIAKSRVSRLANSHATAARRSQPGLVSSNPADIEKFLYERAGYTPQELSVEPLVKPKSLLETLREGSKK
jgi:hypothetical protein